MKKAGSITQHLAALLLCLFSMSVSHADTGITIFEKESYQQILDRYQGKPLLLNFWSLDCPPCLKEFSVLSEISRQLPDISIVMVSVDGADTMAEAQQTLNQHGLGHLEHWIFPENHDPVLRYQVDPLWYGELPRNYFFDRQQQRLAHSGSFSLEQVKDWLASLDK
jgi:thiol-disulfide isomerase/thioredoxin